MFFFIVSVFILMNFWIIFIYKFYVCCLIWFWNSEYNCRYTYIIWRLVGWVWGEGIAMQMYVNNANIANKFTEFEEWPGCGKMASMRCNLNCTFFLPKKFHICNVYIVNWIPYVSKLKVCIWNLTKCAYWKFFDFDLLAVFVLLHSPKQKKKNTCFSNNTHRVRICMNEHYLLLHLFCIHAFSISYNKLDYGIYEKEFLLLFECVWEYGRCVWIEQAFSSFLASLKFFFYSRKILKHL